VSKALTRYRFFAYATGVVLLLLTLHVIVQAAQAHSEHVAFTAAPGLGRGDKGQGSGTPKPASRWVGGS